MASTRERDGGGTGVGVKKGREKVLYLHFVCAKEEKKKRKLRWFFLLYSAGRVEDIGEKGEKRGEKSRGNRRYTREKGKGVSLQGKRRWAGQRRGGEGKFFVFDRGGRGGAAQISSAIIIGEEEKVGGGRRGRIFMGEGGS